MSNIKDYQAFLKIISWEDYFKFCNKRISSPEHDYCELTGAYCESDDKVQMLKCSMWKALRNFYNYKVWKEKVDGKDDEQVSTLEKKPKQQINGYRRRGTFKTEDFQKEKIRT